MQEYPGKIVYGEDKIIKTPWTTLSPKEKGLGDSFFKAMTRNKDKTAQIVSATGESDSYGSLLKRCVRTALNMKDLGVMENDVVCVCCENDHINSCVPFVSSLFIGAIPATLEPCFSVTDSKHLLKLVKPKIIFVVSEGLKLIEEALEAAKLKSKIVVFGQSDKHAQFSSFVQEHPKEADFQPFVPASLKSTATIVFSSGSTGLPKGICISHYMCIFKTKGDGHLPSSSVNLNPSSLYWIGSIMTMVIVVLSGATRILCTESQVSVLWNYINKYKISNLLLGSMEAYNLMQAPRDAHFDASSLRNVFVTGGPVPKAILSEMRKILPKTNVIFCYGLTEAANVTIFDPTSKEDMKLARAKPNSCGRPKTGIWYKIVDCETERTLGFNEPGEIRIKSDAVMNGYYKMDSSSVWDSDGWLRTGDVGYYDEDFCFYINDRIKDMMLYDGHRVLPAKIEKILMTHPAVKETVVFGTPHEIHGDLPTALVVLKNNYLEIACEEIEEYVAKHLDDAEKLRGGVKVVERLLYTSTGKFRRHEMKKLYLCGEMK